MQRSFLFLQGVVSPLFPRLADRLTSRGHRVQRVNFCAGDAWTWGFRPALNYRAGTGGLEDFYRKLFAERSITDLVLFGDERPIHRPAIEIAGQRGITVHVFEEGYLRPFWFTLERDGVNANSRLPRDPDWYRRAAAGLPRPAVAAPAHANLAVRAGRDLAYHLANLLDPFSYPGYRTHRPVPAWREYLGWAWRFAPLPWTRRRDAGAIARLVGRPDPYFLLPLQLDADAQITRHSPFRNMRAVLDRVLTSFAGHAPAATRLVIKNHPLDTGLNRYRKLLGSMGEDLGITGRLLYFETGHMPTLLDHAAGVVTVNSTAGILALQHRIPTIALGDAIYALTGLTFQGELDAFWNSPTPPDPCLVEDFHAVLVHCTQINGDLYTGAGIEMAMDRCVERLEGADPLASLPCGDAAQGLIGRMENVA